MRNLVKVSVSRLLGRFDHTIRFPEEDEFIILHGPNGVGKTMLLELIKAVAVPQRVAKIAAIPFDSATFFYSDGHRIEVSKRDQATLPFEETELEETNFQISFFLCLPDRRDPIRWVANLNPDSMERNVRQFAHRMLPVERIGPSAWRDMVNDDVISWVEVMDRYSDHLPTSAFGRKKFPVEFQNFFEDMDIHLIETQRLLTLEYQNKEIRRHTRDSPVKIAKVTEFSNDLCSRLAEGLAENSRKSQELDRTYPRRLLQASPNLPSEEEIRNRYREQNELRRRLASISLLDEEAEGIFIPQVLEEWQKKVLWTYLEDSEEKLSTFKLLLDRVSLLMEIINARFLSKRLEIDRMRGLNIVTDEGRKLDPSKLSSGEQHELVLLYDLLFNVPAGALVLIDEPEISLHVSWQQRFLNDIGRISELVGFRFIVATHSPQIVGKWIDRAVALAPETAGGAADV